MKHFSELIQQRLSETQLELINRGIIKEEILLTSASVHLVADYLQLLTEWSKKFDLIGPATVELVVERHLCDAYAVWRILSEKYESKLGEILDVGSGAGLPGLVISCLSPEGRVVLCEPREKRVVFLQEVKRRLGLNVSVIRKRAEELTRADVGQASLCLFRALSPTLSILSNLGKLLGEEARFAFITGDEAAPGLQFKEIIRYALTGDSRGRQICLGILNS